MSACQGCGTELPPSRSNRPRKWCSERCRKSQYGGTCVDCNAKLNGTNGNGPNAYQRCRKCGNAEVIEKRQAQAREIEDRIAAMYRQGLLPWQIAEQLGMETGAVTSYAYRARRRIDVPYAATGQLAHRDRVAA